MTTTTAAAPTLMLTLDEVAAELRVSYRVVARLIATGELPAWRRGRIVRVRRSDVEALVAREAS